jgi:glycosyltransferase involved in cell wall biosynthesis
MIKPGSMHGIARYVFQLLACLKSMGTHHQFLIMVNPGSPLEDINWPAHMSLIHVRASWISFREQWEIPRVLKRVSADLFHTPSFVAPILCPCRLVMTIHDLNHMVLPEFYTVLHQIYYQFFVRSCIGRSEYILTVSNFSKAEILRNLQVDPEKVFVTYNGVLKSYQPVADPEYLQYVRDIYELPKNFIFCLSNNKPHKNIHQLVRAYCFSDIDIPLVLASPVDRVIIRIAENYGKKHLIYFSRFIHEDHLPAVYSLTSLFVFPSTYEGFGLPPLEALACGAPVVVARSSSLPEVVGNNAIFTDPYDYQDIARAIKLGIENGQLRSRLIEQGIAHARKFSWTEMTRQTLEIYERCAKVEGKFVEGALT